METTNVDPLGNGHEDEKLAHELVSEDDTAPCDTPPEGLQSEGTSDELVGAHDHHNGDIQHDQNASEQNIVLHHDLTLDSFLVNKLLMKTDLPLSESTSAEAPFHYVSWLPSQGVRNQLLHSLNLWIDAPHHSLPPIMSIIEDVHNISLMLDDAQDGSPLRRSHPAAHSVFGMPQVVNSAIYMLVDVISRAAQLGGPLYHQIITEELKNMLIGQSLDLRWVHDVSAPSVEEYLQMVDGKTGALFRIITRLLSTQSRSQSKPVDLDRLMTLFGRFFQIRDDYANLVLDRYKDKKGFCEDLDEGKMSFILIHALHNAKPATRAILNSLVMERHALGCAGQGHKELMLSIFQETGSLLYAADTIQSLWGEINMEIDALERYKGKVNKPMRAIMDALKI